MFPNIPSPNLFHLMRKKLSNPWLILIFGLVSLMSQLVIALVLEKIGIKTLLLLQISVFSADEYIQIFNQWTQQGLMPFYQAHFIFDNIHWLWYSLFLSTLLAASLEKANIAPRFDFVLAIPFVAGICDVFENRIQLVFLSNPNFLSIIDPLPLLSTCASLTKWILAIITFALIAYFQIKRPSQSHNG